MKEVTNDVVFIRHAESEFNKEVLEYVARKQIAYDWDHLSKDHEFLAQHKYSQHLIDASITAQGRQECEQARKALNGFEPDVIIVSPLNRTLLTCSLIFPEPKCPVIVEPVLSEAIRSSCDISSELSPKKALYPHYNFEKVEAQGEFWFLNNESQENQNVYRKIMQENPNVPFREMLKKFLEVMLETWIYQTATNLRRRTDKVKDLLREYRKKYTSIAVVSHYNIIRFTIAKQFNLHDEPYHCVIKNCEVIPKSVEQL